MQPAKYISRAFIWLLYTFDDRVKLETIKSYTAPPQLYASSASKLSKTLKGNEEKVLKILGKKKHIIKEVCTTNKIHQHFFPINFVPQFFQKNIYFYVLSTKYLIHQPTTIILQT